MTVLHLSIRSLYSQKLAPTTTSGGDEEKAAALKCCLSGTAQLRLRHRRPNETLAELYRDINRLMALAYPNSSGSELHEEIAKSHFISALGDRDFQLKRLKRDAKDLDALFTTAVRLEALQYSYHEEKSREIKPSRGRHSDGVASRTAVIEQKLKDYMTIHILRKHSCQLQLSQRKIRRRQ
jgi:hypothetical protein